MSVARIYSISPYYKGNDESHVFWLETALGAAARNLGFEYCTITGFDDGASNIKKGLSFTASQRHKLVIRPWSKLLRDGFRISKYPKGEGSPVFWHVYDGGFREFLLVCLLLKVNKRSTAIFNFTTLEPWLAVLESPILGIFDVRRALSRVSRTYGSRLTLLADSNELGRAIQGSTRFIKGEYPLFTFMESSISSIESTRLVDSILFTPCDDGELQMCLEAIELIRDRNPAEIGCVIQLRWGATLAPHRVSEIEAQEIRVIQGAISAEEYERLYRNASVAVLPYLNRNYYRYQSSGRLLDSVSRGCLVVAPDDTVLGRKVQQNKWGEVFSGNSSESLANAVLRCIESGAKEIVAPPTAKDAVAYLFKQKPPAENKAATTFPIMSLAVVAVSPALLAIRKVFNS